MTQSLLIKQGRENTGHHKDYKMFFDRGGLDFLLQRMDVGFVEGDKALLPKVFIRIGKCLPDTKGSFRDKNNEIPQEFRTTSPDTIKELRLELLKQEIKLRKAQGNYNFEYHMYEDVKAVARIHKDTHTP